MESLNKELKKIKPSDAQLQRGMWSFRGIWKDSKEFTGYTGTIKTAHDHSSFVVTVVRWGQFSKAKRKRRKLERHWRASRLSVDGQMYVEKCLVVDNMLKKAKASYYSSIISENASNQKVLFSSRQIIESQTGWETLSNLVLRPSSNMVLATTEIGNSFFPILSKMKYSQLEMSCLKNLPLVPSPTQMRRG